MRLPSCLFCQQALEVSAFSALMQRMLLTFGGIIPHRFSLKKILDVSANLVYKKNLFHMHVSLICGFRYLQMEATHG